MVKIMAKTEGRILKKRIMAKIYIYSLWTLLKSND
jgi:hypothetical protein